MNFRTFISRSPKIWFRAGRKRHFTLTTWCHVRVLLSSVGAEIKSVDDTGPGIQAIWIVSVVVHETGAISGTVVSQPLFVLSSAHWLIVGKIGRPRIVANQFIL